MPDAYFKSQLTPEEILKRIEGFPSWFEIDLDYMINVIG